MRHPIYQETQYVRALWWIMPLPTLFALYISWETKAAPIIQSGLGLLILITLLALGRLRTEIDAQELRWHFGFMRWYTWRIALSDVAQVKACTNRWVNGWGIKFTSEGWLYNAHGMQAVRLTLRNGKRLRLGSADATGLATFLSSRITT